MREEAEFVLGLVRDLNSFLARKTECAFVL